MTTISLKSYGLLIKHWVVMDGKWALDHIETHVMTDPSPWWDSDVIL